MILAFFKSKIYIGIIILSSAILLLIFLYFVSIPNLQIFPNTSDFKFNTYSDVDMGGNSKITHFAVTDSAINFDFILHDAIATRYAGINISPKNSKKLDLSQYNECKINLVSKNTRNIVLTLFTPNTYTKKDQSKEIYFSTNIEYQSNTKEYSIDFDDLEVPNWWLDFNEISSKKKIKLDLKYVLSFNISNGYSPQINIPNSLQIHSISFCRNNTPLLLILVIIEIIILVLLFIIHIITFSKSNKPTTITIEYKAIDAENEHKQLHSFIEYINTNFHNCELTLEQVSLETGINHRRIANHIQQNYACNFKTYVNQLRINESKRLLKQTELNMGEIAFKVGFNNQSHFNRVFKSIVELSPSEFRENFN